jgi:hypothetical protein
MEKKILVLAAHSIEYRILKDKLFVKDEYTWKYVYGFNWVDASNWSLTKIIHWLGY